MKALLQRVTRASVSIAGEVVGNIEQGLVIFVGVASGDTEKDTQYLAQKTIGLRIFADTYDTIQYGASKTDGGGYIETTTVGAVCVLESVDLGGTDGYQWVAGPLVETWLP